MGRNLEVRERTRALNARQKGSDLTCEATANNGRFLTRELYLRTCQAAQGWSEVEKQKGNNEDL